MGEMTLDIEGWRKADEQHAPEPIEKIHFRVSEACHDQLEAAEVELQQSHQPEKMLTVDPSEIDLVLLPDCGPLSDCQLRVYLDNRDGRGHFHLVGHCQGDNSLVYSNAVMVDALV